MARSKHKQQTGKTVLEKRRAKRARRAAAAVLRTRSETVSADS